MAEKRANEKKAVAAEPASAAPATGPAQPLFYRKVVPLNRDQHRNLYVDPEPGFGFARDTNCVFVATVEFLPVAREYPIVFGQAPDGSCFPLALLGIRNNQNLYLDTDGQWRAKYIPAYIRRYPFILANNADGSSFAVCIDESYPGFNTAREGQPLLTEQGADGPLLQRSVEFLKDYQAQIARTTEFCAVLRELNVLEPVQAQVALKSGEKLSLTGMLCVNRERLQKLDDARLLGLVRREFLELIYLHLHSLQNMDALLDRLPPIAVAQA